MFFLAGHLNSLNDGMEWLHKPIQKCCERKEAHSTTPINKVCKYYESYTSIRYKFDYNTSCKVTQHIIPPPPKKKKSTPNILQQKISFKPPLSGNKQKKQH